MTGTISAPAGRTRSRRLAWLAVALTTGLATAVSGATLAPAEAAPTSQYGTLSGPSGQLPAANKCGIYFYRYDLKPPPGDWGLETFVIDPRGNTVASYAAIDNYTAGGTSGSTSFTLCRNNTAPGVFTIAGKLSTADGTGKVTNYEMTPATFTLTEATRASTRANKSCAKKFKKGTKQYKKCRTIKKRRNRR